MIDADNWHMTHYPAQVLTQAARPIEKIDESLHRLVEKMTDTMIENKGVGLAGPQVGVPLRIFIISLDGSRDAVKVYINPTVTPTTAELHPAEEGCLSGPCSTSMTISRA
jgi:peptide deformylase